VVDRPDLPGNGTHSWTKRVRDRIRRGGNGGDPAGEVKALEAMLEELAAEKARAEARLATLEATRRSLILQDAADGDILALATEKQQLELQIERITTLQPSFVEQLAILHAKQRAARWTALIERHDRACEVFLEAAARFIDAHDALKEVIEGAASAGFEWDRAGRFVFPPFPFTADRPTLARLRHDFDTKRGLPSRLISPQPVKTSAEPAGALPHETVVRARRGSVQGLHARSTRPASGL
jgi:hypothetical protein